MLYTIELTNRRVLLHSGFLEQWTDDKGLDTRSGLFGPSFIADENGDFVQITEAAFSYTKVESKSIIH